ncbi:MAG: ATP-binding protein, partial [Sciscionella sp.]
GCRSPVDPVADSRLNSLRISGSGIKFLVMGVRAGYLPRVVDSELDDALGWPAAVLIEGAKGVGKTATASQRSRSQVLLDVDQGARAAAAIDPSLVLAGDKPRLIDEWQVAPSIWNHVRRAVDAHEGPFILTGSATPADDAVRHTGAGRFSRLRMRPMTLFELGRSSGAVSLGRLLDGEPTATDAGELSIPDLADVTCTGGWPGLVGHSVTSAQRVLTSYLDSVSRTDIRRVDGVAREPAKVWSVLRALARNVGTEASIATIARDAGGSDGPADDDTARAYLAALERLMVVEDQPAWAPRLRSRSRLRSAPKRHFCDPSLAPAALQATPAQLLRDLNYFGFLFESLVVRDLRVYAQHLGATVSHYRDNIGEVDAIVDAGVRWGALEVKLGTTYVEEAARSLKKFVGRVDTAHRGEPAFLGVVVPTRYGYKRDDGICVIPVQGLGP